MAPNQEEWPRTNGRSLSFSGHPLWGDRAVRFLFMDEAGISALEPVTVVVGILADADAHIMAAEALALEAHGCIPPQFRDGFSFSAKTVFGDKKYKDDWLQTSRMNFLKSMMSIPRRIGMGISIAAVWRGHGSQISAGQVTLRPEQHDHFIAFSYCITQADAAIRKNCPINEVGTIVAENHEEMRQFLKELPKYYKHNPFFLKPSHLRKTQDDIERGYVDQNTDFRISRIRNTVHWVEKNDDPLVQIADACAYALRRYFAKESFGEEFAEAVVGDLSQLRRFGAPGGAECYWSSVRESQS